MNNASKPANLLASVQLLALKRNEHVMEALRADGHGDLLALGGSVFLGRYYCASDRVYFGLNPGAFGTDQENDFDVNLRANDNGPFDFEGPTDFPYWRNMRTFLTDNPDLKKWFNDRVTHAFLIPWRTPNAQIINHLGTRSREAIYKSSAELAEKIVNDHNAKTVVVAGKTALYKLNAFLNLGLSYQDIRERTVGKRTYQWGGHPTQRGFEVVQIPHFSRANSSECLRPLADWLRRELGL